jgi:stress response protein YsnF
MNPDFTSDLYCTKVLDVGEATVIPLLEETFEVSRTLTETGALRVRVLIEETLSSAAVDLVQEVVTSTRVPRGVEAHERVEPWNEGDTLIVPIYEEVIVTERRLMLKEEIHITRRTTYSTELVERPLRQERAVVERRSHDGVWIAVESVRERASDDMASHDRTRIPEHDAVENTPPATAGAKQDAAASGDF